MTETNPITDFDRWHVENLRLTIFCTLPPTIPGTTHGLWERAMRIPPEDVVQRPRERSIREQGFEQGNTIRLVTQANRLDWSILPGPVTDPGTGISIMVVKASEQAISILHNALDVSIQVAQQVQRLAFGAVLIQQASSIYDAMTQLSNYLPHLDLENRGGSDFIYQINRPQRSPSAPHVRINCLTKWQLDQFQSGVFLIGPSQAPQLETTEAGLVNRLTLDINTAPDNNAISASRMPGLFVELTEFARQIAAKGDVL